ncbi:MAG TPA: hypothetical protein VFN30_00345 [Chitinophagaceae bacterium]|nr:hypothetical protein [Chitinophagaceae bacterium]
MKRFCFLIIFIFAATTIFSQTVIKFPPDSLNHTTLVKVFPNPTKQLVEVQVKEWSTKSRYTLNILNSNGKRISTRVLQGPIETVELKTGGGRKATMFIEVWKEKELIGRETVVVIK